MSVIIDMDMPNNCWECPIINGETGECKRLHKIICDDERPRSCPLQEQKTGHWIRWYEQKETERYIENIPHCKCSECGKKYDPHSSQFIKFCSNCGARMVEPQESEGKE